MCSRYNLTSPPEAVRAWFRLGDIEPFPPRYNIAPSEPVAIVRQGLRGVAELALVRWGLVPSWVKDPRERAPIINARLETAADKSSFRGALRHRRCIVPADGFYEWTGPRGGRSPWLVRRPGGGLLALAGLWEHWLGADGSEIETMAILTVPANAEVAAAAERMPVIIAADDFEAWLDTRSGLSDAAAKLMEPAPDGLLELVAVETRLDGDRSQEPET